MGRPKLKLVITEAQRAELRHALKDGPDSGQRERLQALQLANPGRHPHQEIAQLLGKARSTIQLWLDYYEAGQLPRLLARKSAPGKTSELQDPKMQEQLQAGLKAGCWRTAAQIAAWLAQTHGIQRAAGSLYYWLGKAGGTLPVPRPAHTGQDPAAPAEFSAHLLQKRQALPLTPGQPVKVRVADECRAGWHTFTRRGGEMAWPAGGGSQATGLPVGICPWGGGSGDRRPRVPVLTLGKPALERRPGTQPGGGFVGSNQGWSVPPRLSNPGGSGSRVDRSPAPVLGG